MNCPPSIHRVLCRSGLVHDTTPVTLGDYYQQFLDGRPDLKPATIVVFERARKHLLRFFPATIPLDEVTPGAVTRYRATLVGRGLADNTVRCTLRQAKQVFDAAKRDKLLDDNPFNGVKTTVGGNRDRYYFISRLVALRVLDALPDAEWRLLFALCRFGGLRCPSELTRLRWGDIDWEHSRITVHSPKTEHHPGMALWVPAMY